MIKIINATKKNKITNISYATNIFNLMKGELNKNPELKEFVLDFSNIIICNDPVFKEIFRQMRTKLSGQFQVRLVNANPMVALSFNIAVKNKGGK